MSEAADTTTDEPTPDDPVKINWKGKARKNLFGRRADVVTADDQPHSDHIRAPGSREKTNLVLKTEAEAAAVLEEVDRLKGQHRNWMTGAIRDSYARIADEIRAAADERGWDVEDYDFSDEDDEDEDPAPGTVPTYDDDPAAYTVAQIRAGFPSDTYPRVSVDDDPQADAGVGDTVALVDTQVTKTQPHSVRQDLHRRAIDTLRYDDEPGVFRVVVSDEPLDYPYAEPGDPFPDPVDADLDADERDAGRDTPDEQVFIARRYECGKCGSWYGSSDGNEPGEGCYLCDNTTMTLVEGARVRGYEGDFNPEKPLDEQDQLEIIEWTDGEKAGPGRLVERVGPYEVRSVRRAGADDQIVLYCDGETRKLGTGSQAERDVIALAAALHDMGETDLSLIPESIPRTATTEGVGESVTVAGTADSDAETWMAETYPVPPKFARLSSYTDAFLTAVYGASRQQACDLTGRSTPRSVSQNLSDLRRKID